MRRFYRDLSGYIPNNHCGKTSGSYDTWNTVFLLTMIEPGRPIADSKKKFEFRSGPLSGNRFVSADSPIDYGCRRSRDPQVERLR